MPSPPLPPKESNLFKRILDQLSKYSRHSPFVGDPFPESRQMVKSRGGRGLVPPRSKTAALPEKLNNVDDCVVEDKSTWRSHYAIGPQTANKWSCESRNCTSKSLL